MTRVPRVTAVLNQKGGAGKTTLAVNLAAGLARRRRTRLLDLDPQGSALQWAAQGAGLGAGLDLDVQPCTGRAALVALGQAAHDVDELVLDCPPSAEHAATAAALRVCQVALLPVLPSPVDLWASLRLQQLIEDTQREQVRRGDTPLQAWLVVNQLEPRSALSAAMDGALAEFGLPVLASRIQRRAAFRTAALEGASVYQLGARGKAAAADIDTLINEVYER